jgi:small subunit ribosomal protein S20
MPIIKSAKKRVRVAEKAAIRNSKTKRSLKGALKAFGKAVTGGDKKASVTNHGKAQSALDKAVKKGVIHKNKAARQKKQLAAKAKDSAGVTKTATVKVAKAAKPAAKKPAVKKAAPAKKPAAAKKPVAKKAPAKKPAAKK